MTVHIFKSSYYNSEFIAALSGTLVYNSGYKYYVTFLRKKWNMHRPQDRRGEIEMLANTTQFVALLDCW